MSKPPVKEMVRLLIGCKWSLMIFQAVVDGTNRPGALVRQIEGLSTKVLNECLKRHLEFGILEKNSFPESPPRVEYSITAFGRRFIGVLEAIDALDDRAQAPSIDQVKSSYGT